jgi:hypothetical protein
MRILLWLTFGVCLAAARANEDGLRGVIDDPDGYVNVRAEKGTDSRVVAKVKTGEPFAFSYKPGDEWARVTLPSGLSGWMHHSRIRLFFAKENLPKKEAGEAESEMEETARRHGVDYYATIQGAVRGDAKARKNFFALTESVDGAAAEEFEIVLPTVFHLIGDDAFANFLRGQPLGYQLLVRNSLTDGLATAPFESTEYLSRHFPKTAEIFFRKEIIDWLSPDGRYAIRKFFSDPLDLRRSKVSKSELIEKSSGQVRCDLTRDDIGFGRDREGSVLWSPDSKRFAYLSSNLTVPAGNLFSRPPPAPQKKETSVYQLSGNSFVKVDLPLDKPPGRDSDSEIKGAKVGHEFVEPVRWSSANELILERHDYYEDLTGSSGSIHSFDRLYEIKVAIREDGTAETSWKLREDR